MADEYTNIHSSLHLLVKEMREDFGETSKKGVGSFGFYLGFLKRIGEQRARTYWSEVKELPDRSSRRKVFWYKIKNRV